jgi:hypothetical protein
VKLKLKLAAATPAPEPSAPGESTPVEPTTATQAPDPLAPGESTPTEPAPKADATLPDLPPPELQQGEARAGGEEQVEAPDAAPTDGTGKRLTAHGWLPRPRRYVLKASGLASAQQPRLKKPQGPRGVLVNC